MKIKIIQKLGMKLKKSIPNLDGPEMTIDTDTSDQECEERREKR